MQKVQKVLDMVSQLAPFEILRWFINVYGDITGFNNMGWGLQHLKTHRSASLPNASLAHSWHKCTKLSHPNKPFSAIIKPNGHQAHFQALQVLFQCFWPAGSDTWDNGFIMTVSFHQQWSLWKGCRSDHPSNLGSRLIYIWPFAMYFLTVQPMCCHPGGGGCCQVFCWSSNCLNWKRVVNLLGLPCHLKLLTLLLTFTFHCQQTQ